MTLSGIEPATFRFVAQHLNHCATAVPKKNDNGQEICHQNCGPPKNDDCTVVGAHVVTKKGNLTQAITTLSSINFNGYCYLVRGSNTCINVTTPDLLASMMSNNTQLFHIQ